VVDLLRGLDHVAFGAGRLDAARDVFARLGFRTTPRGRCAWTLAGRSFEAGSYSVMFEDTYLDVIEIRDPRWKDALGRRTLARGDLGPSGLVLGAASLDAALERARGAGIGHAPEYRIARTLDGETSELRYRIFALEPSRASAPVMVIEDGSPGAMRKSGWTDHPNAVSRLRSAIVHSGEPEANASWCRALFGAEKVMARDAAFEVATGTADIRWLSDSADPRVSQWIAARPGSADRAFVVSLDFETSDLAAARRALAAGGVPWREVDGGVAVDPAHACGCGALLSQARPESLARGAGGG